MNVVKRCIPLGKLHGLSLSSKQDGVVVIHVSDDYDTPIMTVFKTEFVTMVNAKYALLTGRDIPVQFSDSYVTTWK